MTALAVAGAVLVLPGCRSGGEGAMVSIPPPRGWADDMKSRRQMKDEFFRQASRSPLTPEDIASFRGLEYWEPNSDYYFVGRLHIYRHPEQIRIQTNSDEERLCERYGWVRFDFGGHPRTLQVYRCEAETGGLEDLLLPFMDQTSGAETYPAGRYVDLVGPRGGPYILDFNMAYNPYCAYGSRFFSCPVTPPENRLDVRIESGERGFRHSDAGGGGAGGAER